MGTRAFTQATEDTAIANGTTSGAFSWSSMQDRIMVANVSGAVCYLTFADDGDTATTASATVHDYVLPDGQAVVIEADVLGIDGFDSISVWMVSGGTNAGFTVAGQ